jgi:small subunit ribosomal protein S15
LNDPESQFVNTTGLNNVSVGKTTLQANISGYDNTAVGTDALFYSTGNANTAFGGSAGNTVTTGSNNTLIGHYAGFYDVTGGSGNITGSNNIVLGSFANMLPNKSGSNQMNLGNIIFATDIGTSNIVTGNVGIGTSTPDSKLRVIGTTKTDDFITKGPYTDVRYYGAKGDGVNDDTLAIQAALDYVNSVGGGTVFFPKQTGSYIVSSSIAVGSNTHLDFENSVIIDFSGAATGDTLFEVIGTFGVSSGLTANSLDNDLTLDLTDATLFNVGDVINIRSNAAYYGSDKKGEFHIIKSKTGNQITLEDGLWDSYLTTDSSLVTLIQSKNNIKISGGKFIGGGSGKSHNGINLELVKNGYIENAEFENFENRAVRVYLSNNIDIEKLTVHKSNQVGLGYGVSVNSSQWVNVTNSSFYYNRHGFASGGSVYGPARFVKVLGNNFYGTTNAGIDSHPSVQFINFSNNTVTNSGGTSDADGIIVQGKDAIIEGNIIKNSKRHGIAIQSSVSSSTYTIANNQILDSQDMGIVVSAIDLSSIIGLSISNNQIQDPASYGIYIASLPGDISRININNNIIRDASRGIVLHANTGNMVVASSINSNIITGTSTQGIQLISTTGNITNLGIANNTIENATVGIVGNEISTGQISEIFVSNNNIKGATTNISLPSISTNIANTFGDIRIGTSGTNGCLQRFDGTALTGTCSSDENLKTNIKTLDNADIATKLGNVDIVEYNWNETANKEYSKATKKQAIIKKVQTHATDTGSPEVQISILSMKIEELANHLKTHKKDNHSRKGLIKMVADRRGKLTQYKKADSAKHEVLMKKLNLG